MITFLRWLAYLVLVVVTLTPVMFWRLLPIETSLSSPLAIATFGHFGLCILLFMLLRHISDRAEEARVKALLFSSAQFISLYESSPVPYVTLDSDSRVVMYNAAAVNLFETTTDALPGLRIKDYIFLDDEAESAMLQSKINSKLKLVDQEAKLRTTSGSLLWVLFSVFDYKGEEHRLMSFIDITRQKAVDAAKTDFVALATHQLRTPITAIRWNVELLAGSLQVTQTSEQADYLTKINRNILRMLALVDDFLSVSKLEMGTFATSTKQLDLTTFGDGIVEEFEQRLVENHLTFKRSDNPPNLPFKTDPRLLNIIVSNLISNAVKYVSTGDEVTYQYSREGDKLIIKVSDSGIGIPKDEQGKLFNKFFRARNASAHKASGTGLGLYIVKQSVEKLEGTIEVESAEDKGSTFTITLPYN